MEEADHGQAHEDSDSDSGVQERYVRGASARKQQYGSAGVETVHVELPGADGATRPVHVAGRTLQHTWVSPTTLAKIRTPKGEIPSSGLTSPGQLRMLPE